MQLLDNGRFAPFLAFNVRSTEPIFIPPFRQAARADGLWRTTCFEMFVRAEGERGYFEFNFSPSTEWAAYAFTDYRMGMRTLDVEDPEIWTSSTPPIFELSVEALDPFPAPKLHVGLSAVIEEIDGTKSYWALRHPQGPPDFHHPDCFALTLAAPDAA